MSTTPWSAIRQSPRPSGEVELPEHEGDEVLTRHRGTRSLGTGELGMRPHHVLSARASADYERGRSAMGAEIPEHDGSRLEPARLDPTKAEVLEREPHLEPGVRVVELSEGSSEHVVGIKLSRRSRDAEQRARSCGT